jgi:arsenate reductase
MTFRTPADISESFFPKLRQYLEARIDEFREIPPDRKVLLESLAGYIREKRLQSAPVALTFICTHNSRRSHLSQLWAHVAAVYFGLENVQTFSGGTEATAFNPRAVAAMQRAGLEISKPLEETDNPKYLVRASEGSKPWTCYSKVFDQAPNPTEGYAAIMTCSQADDACPVVMGCEQRIPIRYEDPKVADDTSDEAAVYDERAAQICREMLYVMARV